MDFQWNSVKLVKLPCKSPFQFIEHKKYFCLDIEKLCIMKIAPLVYYTTKRSKNMHK